MHKKNIDFFISYSHHDKQFVDQLVQNLESCGVACWYAPRNVVGRYAKAICDAIENSKVFLLILSEHSAVSNHVLNEVEMVYNMRTRDNREILIEPLCINSTDLDSKEFDEIMYYIRRINFITPTQSATPQEFVSQLLSINKGLLNIKQTAEKRPAEASRYYSSARETERLRIQDILLSTFDLSIYKQVLGKYPSPLILDVGCGNGTVFTNRLTAVSANNYKLIGVDRDEAKITEAQQMHEASQHVFFVANIETDDFIDILTEKMKSQNIEAFDIINISMLLLHLKNPCRLFRRLRRVLSPDGSIIIRDIDDGLNYVYPDPNDSFERIYRICDRNETSGNRHCGRSIYSELTRAGYHRITLEKQGLSTIGLNYEQKESFFNMYFRFILGDARWMHERYPNDEDIAEDYEWYSSNYDELFEHFMNDDTVCCIGFQLYTAQK